MDYRLREPDNRAPYLSPRGANGYFASEAIRVGYIHGDPNRELLQREIEKKRIREEILAQEAARRRELEEEVRRELALERELGSRLHPDHDRAPFSSQIPETRVSDRFPLPPLHDARATEQFPLPSRPEIRVSERFPILQPPRPEGRVGERGPMIPHSQSEIRVRDRLQMLHHRHEALVQERLPLPQVPEVMNKSGPFPAGPWVPNLTGSKRKAEATTSAQKKPKATNPAHNWKCALCQVSCTSKDLLNEHKLGKKHRAKLEELQIREESPNSAPKEEDSDTKLQVEGSQKNPKKKRRKQKAKAISEEKKSANGGDGEALKVDGEKQGISSKKKDGQKLGREKFAVWCEKCNVGCTSQSVMNHHIRGKKHLARLEAEMKKEREKREREKRAALAKEAAAVGEAKVKNDVEEEREKRAEERKEGGNEEVGEKPKVEIEVEAKHVVDEKIQG